MPNEIVQIKLDDLIPNRFQPREIFDEKALNELADSIKQIGVIEPIIVRPIGSKYEIVAGERRYKASVLAGLNVIPCIVRELTDKESSIYAYVENAQRRSVSAIEEARVSERILHSNNYSQDELSNQLGVNKSTVANNLRLLSLPLEVQESLMRNEISEKHARLLLNIKDQEKQIELLERIKKERMSVRDLESEIKNMFNNDNVTINYNSGSFIPPRTDLNTPIPEINVAEDKSVITPIDTTPIVNEVKVEQEVTPAITPVMPDLNKNYLNVNETRITEGNLDSYNPALEKVEVKEFKPMEIEDHSTIESIEPSFVPPTTIEPVEENGPEIDFSSLFNQDVQNALNNMNIKEDEKEEVEDFTLPVNDVSYLNDNYTAPVVDNSISYTNPEPVVVPTENNMNLYGTLDDFLTQTNTNTEIKEPVVENDINKVEDVSNLAVPETNDFLDFANNFNPALYENDINSTTVAPPEIIEETKRIQEEQNKIQEQKNVDFNNFINKYDSNYGVSIPKTEVYQEESVPDFTNLGNDTPVTTEVNNELMDFTNLGKDTYVEQTEGFHDARDTGTLQSVEEVIAELKRVCDKIKNCKYKVDTEEIDYDDIYQITIKIDKRDI